MNEPNTQSQETVTFKKSHFYAPMVVLAFAVGILVGYVAWGRDAAPRTAALAIPVAQAAPPTERVVRRYDIPTEGFYSLGPADAPIVLVEFSDYQCPYCKRWHDEVYKSLMAAYPGQVRFIYRNLPLTQIHPQAMNAAEAALCAGKQDAYWQYHEKLFENSAALSDDLYASLAADLGLDASDFASCMTEHKYLDDIQADMQFAVNLGVQSTPTFFINGLAVVGAQPLSVFQQVIDDELAGNNPQ